ncbi:MAG: hypothetical protein ACI4TK_00335, partial [Agathobacter sp.]
MVQIGSVICEIALWFGGIVFIHREEERNNFSMRMWISSIIAVALCVALSIYYGGDFPFREGILQVVSTAAGVAFMLWNWKTTPSIAIYNFIWTRIVWWLTIELYQFIILAIERVVLLTVLAHSLILVLLFVISYGICNFTIARWIPENGKKRIG